MVRKNLQKPLGTTRPKRFNAVISYTKNIEKVKKKSNHVLSRGKKNKVNDPIKTVGTVLRKKFQKFTKHQKSFWSKFGELVSLVQQNINKVLIFFTIFFSVVLGSFFYSQAEYAKFYPAACLGGWQNPKNAEGKPELSPGAEPSEFNDTNSATLLGAASQIFCGSFIGEIPKDAEMKTLLVKLSWMQEGGARDDAVSKNRGGSENLESAASDTSASSTVTVNAGDAAASSTQAILDAPEGSAVEIHLDDVPPVVVPTEGEPGSPSSGGEGEKKKESEEVTETTPATVPAPADSSVAIPATEAPTSAQNPETTPSPTETTPATEALIPAETTPSAPPLESAPVSLFDRLFQQVFAEEMETVSDAAVTLTPEITTDAESSTTNVMVDETATTTEQPNIETAEQPPPPPTSPEFLEILYTLDGTEWHSLGKVSKTDWKDEFKIPLTEWSDISKLQISIQSLPSIDTPPKIYLDGMWLEAEYGDYEDGWSEDIYATTDEIAGLPEVRVEGNKMFRFSKTDFRADEEPLFELVPQSDLISTSTELFASTTEQSQVEVLESSIESTTTASTTAQKRNLFLYAKHDVSLLSRLSRTAQNFFAVHAAPANNMKIVRVVVTDHDGADLPNMVDVEILNGKPTVWVAKPKDHFRPGAYELHVDILRGGKIFSSVQKFTWGVLAINTNKSVYLPGETAYLQMAGLDDLGYAVCSADLKLEIESPSFEKTVFVSKASSTSNGTEGTIEQTPSCSRNNVTDLPDYFAHYIASGAGTYRMTLTNLENGYHVTDSFEVRASVPFEVERVGATRINPFASAYAMTMNIRANQDFAGKVIEPIPDDFEIQDSATSPAFHVENTNTGKYIVWDIDMKIGDTLTLAYTYQALRVSPQFYLLGPLRFEESVNWLERITGLVSSDKPVFEEQRRWQLAGDAEATIEAAVSSTANFHKINPKLIFTSDQVGFMFYFSSSVPGYASTTDGGATWKAKTNTSALDTRQHSVWYDRWTPGNTGNRIHLAYNDSTSDDLYYDYIDVNGVGAPTQGTEVAIDAGSTSLGVTDEVTITQATDGTLYIAYGDDTTAGVSKVMKCSTTCTSAVNWSAAGTSPLDQTADPIRLIALNNNNIMLLKDDVSAEDILSNIYSATSSSWWGWNTIDANAIDSTTYLDTIAPTLNYATGEVYLAYGADVGGNNIADIRTAIWNPTTLAWTAKTDVLTNSTTTNISIALDENTGDTYVGYLRGTPASAINAYYKKSTDGMATWGAETQFNTTGGNLQWIYLNMMSNQRIYGAYEQVTNLDMLGNTIADLSPPTFEQAAYRLFANDNSTDVGATLAATSTAATLVAAGDAFRLRVNLHVAAGDLGKDHQGFKLQFAAKSGTCDTAFSGESYDDVTASSVIAFNDNGSATDGAALTANANDPLHGAGPDTLNRQTYVESNSATNTVSRINAATDGLWDFSLKDNSAPANTSYCFRMATSSNAYILDSSFSYSVVPEITTASGGTLTLVATTDSFATLTPGTPKYATTTLSVTSSGASWNVSMYGNNQGSLAASTTLYLSPTSYSIGIPDSTEWQPGSGTTTAGNAGTASGSTTLAFRVMSASGSQPFRSPTWWGSSDVNLNASQYWAGIASTTASNKRIVISSIAAPSAILGTVQYYLDVPASQQAGAYTGDITFTLTDAL